MKSGDFYNRVFTSNRVLNTTTVQPVVRPAKIENGEEIKSEKIIKQTLKSVKQPIIDNKLLEKYDLLELQFNELKQRLEVLETKLEDTPKVTTYEIEEFDKILEDNDEN
jgi:hypothetical protein